MSTVPNEDNLTSHNYDGIQEYDNPTPGWWTWLFIATIVFSAIYIPVMFLTMGLLSPQAFYERDYTESLRLSYGEIKDPSPTPATLMMLAQDEKWKKVGASLYSANCVSCHGADGSGISGPNLTDDHYINVKTVADIADVIKVGRKNGAMPAWENRLQPVEITLASAYVASLRGKNLPSIGGRPAEGEVIPPFTDK
jgi:cytochrome c oxidase cbb3-type subunit 3